MKELRQKIITLFRQFSMNPHLSPLKKEKDRAIAVRFIDKLTNPMMDTGELPYFSPDGTAKGANKAECVFAMMSEIVQTYWEILQAKERGDGDAKPLTEMLDDSLKKLTKVYNNYRTLNVMGDSKGYCLLESYRKDLYEQEKKEQTAEKSREKEVDEGADSRSEIKPESEGKVEG
jgi:hypothetical protein